MFTAWLRPWKSCIPPRFCTTTSWTARCCAGWRESAHVTFGEKETILAGDALLALANKIGAGYGKARLSYHLAEGIMETVVGEIREIAALDVPSDSSEVYLDIITGKTACLIRASCLLGAILADADPECEEAAAGFGLDVGIAFQLVDDALDYDSSASDMGKPAGGDLLEGKVTWPLILHLRDLSEGERDALLGAIRMKSLTPDEVTEIVETVRNKGHAERTREYAAEHVKRALGRLRSFPDTPERRVLEQAAGFVLVRSK